MSGEIIIEAASGAGRFTEQAAATGAMVLSLDYSHATDANYAINGHRPNVLIAQGDIYRMPFPEDYADRIFCFGALQHTPDPRAAFLSLPRHLKHDGELIADVYIKSIRRYWLQSKYVVRPFLRSMEPERLYRYVRLYIELLWPLASLLRRLPRIGPWINWRLLVADYSHVGVPPAMLKEWAVLNTFDMLAPRFDKPQTLSDVREWLRASNLADAQAYAGMNGIVIRGRKSARQGRP